MIADELALRQQIRASADEAVGEFIESLDFDVGAGIPAPPKIEISDVEAQPIEMEFLPFGTQGSSTTPTQGTPPFSIAP